MKLVFDVGGTNIRLGLSHDGREFQEVVRLKTDQTAKGLETFCDALRQLTLRHRPLMVGGGLPGHVDASSGRLSHAPNLPGWEGKPVRQLMEAAVGQPVRLQNDAALAGLAEAVLGAGRSHKVVVYITVSTGVNGVRVVDGRIDPARYGFELGAQLVPDAQGHPVMLESLVGGAALQHKYGRPPVELRHDASVWVTEARYLAIGLQNTLVHWSPDIVVYGGSMMHDIALSAIRHELAKYPAPAGLRPPLHLAELDDNRGLHGALVWLK